MAVRALLHYALEVPDQTVGDSPRGQHGSFEVGSVDEIAVGALAMQAAGFQPVPGAVSPSTSTTSTTFPRTSG